MTEIRTVPAAMAAILALTAAAHADQKTVSFNVAPGACSHPISVPANNRPVITAGANIQYPNRHTALATLLRVNKNGALLSWSGTDVTGAVTGDSIGDGAHIMYLDFGQLVDMQTAPSTHIKVCNSSENSGSAFGYLTFFY